MIKLLVILFTIKLDAHVNIFKSEKEIAGVRKQNIFLIGL